MFKLIFDAAIHDWSVLQGGPELLKPTGRALAAAQRQHYDQDRIDRLTTELGATTGALEEVQDSRRKINKSRTTKAEAAKQDRGKATLGSFKSAFAEVSRRAKNKTDAIERAAENCEISVSYAWALSKRIEQETLKS